MISHSGGRSEQVLVYFKVNDGLGAREVSSVVIMLVQGNWQISLAHRKQPSQSDVSELIRITQSDFQHSKGYCTWPSLKRNLLLFRYYECFVLQQSLVWATLSCAVKVFFNPLRVSSSFSVVMIPVGIFVTITNTPTRKGLIDSCCVKRSLEGQKTPPVIKDHHGFSLLNDDI